MLCFEKPLSSFLPPIFITVAKIQLCIDFLVSINTGYYDKGIQILNRFLIFKNWLKSSIF